MRILFSCFAALAIFLFSPAAHCGVVELRPTTLTINPQEHIAVLSLQNPEAVASVFQVNIYSWHQKGNDQILEPTNDVIASPPIVSLGPRGTQVVRVGLRAPDLPPDEKTYRLVLEEIPTHDQFERPGLNIALRVSLPLFVRPESSIPSARLQADMRIADGAATVTVHNEGQYTTRLTEAVLHASALPDNDKGIESKNLTYALPGSWATYRFQLPPAVASLTDAKITVQTEDGPTDLAAPLMSSEAAINGPTIPR